MGWITTRRVKGRSNKEFFSAELDGPNAKVLDAATKKSVCYLAVQTPKGVQAWVIPINWAPRAYQNFGYKVMEESMGPNESQCPERILKQLSPLDQLYNDGASGDSKLTWASEWRARCWQDILKRRARKPVRKGDIICFAKPIEFVDNTIADTFRLIKGNSFRLANDNAAGVFHIADWRDRDYELVEGS